eukprot:3126997-Pleurochrysis_carterae.AAC.1
MSSSVLRKPPRPMCEARRRVSAPPSACSSSDAKLSILATIWAISPQSGPERWRASSSTFSASLTWTIFPAGSACSTLTQANGHPSPKSAQNHQRTRSPRDPAPPCPPVRSVAGCALGRVSDFRLRNLNEI